MSLFICDKYICLLASIFYMMEAMLVKLQICINELWEYQSTTVILTTFVCLHPK